jgi:hypothetical protein
VVQAAAPGMEVPVAILTTTKRRRSTGRACGAC